MYVRADHRVLLLRKEALVHLLLVKRSILFLIFHICVRLS